LATPKTKRQVEQYLRRKQIDPDEAEDIIKRLVDLNYINDAVYAELFTQSKSTKMGKRVIKSKLFMRGVSSELIEQEVSKIEDQTELCKYTAEKYMRNKTRDIKTLNKLFGHLLNKGFGSEEIQEVMKEYRGQ